MSHSTKSSFLKQQIGLLVQHFGAEKVRVALEQITIGSDEEAKKPPRRPVSVDARPTRPNVADALELIRETDLEKHRLLNEFYICLKDRRILPESEDIRHFAQLIGIKEINAKSRKEMVPKLMRFLLEQPTEQLRIHLPNAATISERQRQQGFSVLTDKLLGEK